ncbi:hypothetical protein [Micromonospora sp. KC207]|uniref:hypothetical protein n=1 Tax=Micromonospora sp. KC207 TaxID=2530377 RepID=UPI00140433D7|nr:hypothetical protein [Micromonospora sp. KC207]
MTAPKKRRNRRGRRPPQRRRAVAWLRETQALLLSIAAVFTAVTTFIVEVVQR